VILSDVTRLFRGDLSAVIEAARIADAAGIDQIAVPDHLAIGTRTDLYPGGQFHYSLEENWGEPLMMLASIAQATSRVRLATAVLLAPLRPALLLAKSLATLDVLSKGRIDIGVGTGWQQQEIEAGSVAFATRGRRMNDTLRACKALWRSSPASFESDTVSFRELRCLPLPVQPDGIPIWVGGNANPRNIERITELAVGWMPILSASSAELESGTRALREAFTKAGRDPAELQVRAGLDRVSDAAGNLDLDATLAGLDKLPERGVTHAGVGLEGFVRGADEVRPFLERVGAAARRS